MTLSHDQHVTAIRKARGAVIGVNRQVKPPVPIQLIVADRSGHAGTSGYGLPVAVSVAFVVGMGAPPPDAAVWRPKRLMDHPDPSERILAEAMRRARIGR